MSQQETDLEQLNVFDLSGFAKLITLLQEKGYTTVGPTVEEGAIVYDEIDSIEDLPIGLTDEQAGGKYELRKRNDHALFGYVVGPHSWKKFLNPAGLRLWQARRNGRSFEVLEQEAPAPSYAFIGARACELNAIAIQDRVFLKGSFVDSDYAGRRQNIFVVAVNCGQAGGTCFCDSMNAGPKAKSGYDLVLTEIKAQKRNLFVVEAGSEAGANLLHEVPHEPATEKQMARVSEVVSDAVAQMGRQLDTRDLQSLLYRNSGNGRWNEVAERCLACANCTMVCPTCFCSTVEDTTDLTGEHAERWRLWDSCFTQEFSYVHGGSVRSSISARYRQWITHKLASWVDQFGSSGCVGCGRCITWCPVGIDITEEIAALREADSGLSSILRTEEKE